MKIEPKLWLVINRASGSHDEALVEALCKRLGEGGFPVARTSDCRDENCPISRDALPGDVSHVVVLGGDGTLNSTLLALAGWNGKVLPLPGGTMNLLCKQLHGDDDALAICSRFVEGALQTRRLPIVAGSTGSALAEVVAGPGAIWADVREDIRDGEASAMIEDAIAATGQAAFGSMTRVVAPRLGRVEGYPAVRITPERDGLRIQGYGGEGWVDFLRQGAAILGRDFRAGPNEEIGSSREVTVETADGSPVELMIDGERRTGGPSETLQLAELDLDLLGAPV